MLIKNLSEEEKKRIIKEALETKDNKYITKSNSAKIIEKSMIHYTDNSNKNK